MIERTGLLLPERTTPQIDGDLLDSLKSVTADKETYQKLTLSTERKSAATAQMHAGENADLRFDASDSATVDEDVANLKQWKRDLLLRTDLDPTVQRLYRWKVNELIANQYMLQASSAGDMDGFRRWNEFVYGTPDEDIYRGALDWIATDALSARDSSVEGTPLYEAAEKVLAMLDGKRGYRELLAPEPETFERVREDHLRPLGYYGLLLNGTPPLSGKVTKEIGDPILEKVIENIGSKKPIADASASTWGVTSAAVLRPATYNMPYQRFIGLGLGHEIGSHELERINGTRGPLALAAHGLDRYESGNEGRAVMREQVPYDTFDQFGKLLRWRDILRRHIAISYASGVGEAAPASSADTYAFMNTIDRMYSIKAKPEDIAGAEAAARKRTSDLIARVLKGTDGTGGAYLKDKVYLEGHVSNWLQAALKGPGVISEGDLGKFDIANDRHLIGLQDVGLLPVEK